MMQDKVTVGSAPQEWGKTLNLPVTDFPMRANLPTREPGWVQRWLEDDVYGKLRAKRRAAGADTFILHLGPPYANGHMHMGHALTYVLKDFIVRHKFMLGLDSPYVPGWDCHGLPIEWKVEQDELRAKGKTKHDVSKAQLRAWCRAFADRWIGVQKQEWQRFGALGDWERPYKTMDAANEAGIVRELGKLVQRGLVYRGLKSTQWSWAEETALAEAEVEYKDVVSTAVYVALPLLETTTGQRTDEHMVIWTTTPWTLPANRAVAVKGDEDYVRVAYGKGAGDTSLWVAAKLRADLAKALGLDEKDLPVLESKDGAALVGLQVAHPLYDTGVFAAGVPVVDGFHVTTDSGTGLVHIAPAHGQEDFTIGQEYGLDLVCPVDGAGKYVRETPDLPLTRQGLAGQLIWPMQKKIVAELEASGRLLKAYDFPHSYPVSWRSKEKLIYRSTEQWFVTMDDALVPETGKSLRDSSLDLIFGRDGVRGVQWVPGYGANRIGSMIEKRPDWCISRQRAWGVPITIFTLRSSAGEGGGEMVTDPLVWDHIAALVEKEGIDAWDTRIEQGRMHELLPAGWLEAQGLRVEDLEPARDILDVWFDSGTSHAHVLRADAQTPGQRFYRSPQQEGGQRPADLYLEGSDQHRGWFHSSLLTSVANYGDAPYAAVVTNGFVVDGEGRKFSKSLGNGVEPRQLLEKYGMDIIRLWVASSDYSEDIRYSPQIMDSMADAYRKFRNTCRWLLGNLADYPAGKPGDRGAVAYTDLPELERYVLQRLHAVSAETRAHFEAYQFHKGYRVLYDFCNADLSNFYFDVRKDVLYCDRADSAARRACQSVLAQVFDVLMTHLAPLIPFTADETWRSRYGEAACVHLETYPVLPQEWAAGADFCARWDAMMALRAQVNSRLEALRTDGKLGANTEAMVAVPEVAGVEGAEARETLRTVLGVSEIVVPVGLGAPETAQEGISALRHDGEKCPRCWRFYRKMASSGLCLRCDEAVLVKSIAKEQPEEVMP